MGKLVRNGHKYLKRVSIRKITTEKVQQWKCPQCGNSYTFRKNKGRISFTDVFIKESVKDFIQGRSSFAVIRQRKGVSIGTQSFWVNDFGKRCMNPIEIAKLLDLVICNKWSGILLLDAKCLNKKKKMYLLLAVDFLTVDVVAYLVVEAETEENYIKLTGMVEACGYEIKVIISDGHPAILALTQPKKLSFRKATRRYPRPGITPAKKEKARLEGIPHQWCCVHAERDLAKKLAKASKEQKLHLRKLVQSVLFAETLPAAKRQMKLLAKRTRNQPKLYREITLWIWERWDMLTLHHTLRVNGRKIPKDTNTVENTISYINTRLKTLRRLRSIKSASNIINLIVVNYRTKPLINTKNKLKKGKCPLALVTGKKRRFDWMEFVKKSCS